MPLLIGIRDGPREWRWNVSLGLKMPVGGEERRSGGSRWSKCIRCQEKRLEDRQGREEEGTSNGCPRGLNGNMLHGTCHFEERPWGGLAYHRAKIFQQTSLSFHLPNADGIGPTPGRTARTVTPSAITAPLFFHPRISIARATPVTYVNAGTVFNSRREKERGSVCLSDFEKRKMCS